MAPSAIALVVKLPEKGYQSRFPARMMDFRGGWGGGRGQASWGVDERTGRGARVGEGTGNCGCAHTVARAHRGEGLADEPVREGAGGGVSERGQRDIEPVPRAAYAVVHIVAAEVEAPSTKPQGGAGEAEADRELLAPPLLCAEADCKGVAAASATDEVEPTADRDARSKRDVAIRRRRGCWSPPGVELVQLRRVHRDVGPLALRASDERGEVCLRDEGAVDLRGQGGGPEVSVQG